MLVKKHKAYSFELHTLDDFILGEYHDFTMFLAWQRSDWYGDEEGSHPLTRVIGKVQRYVKEWNGPLIKDVI